MNPQGSTIVDTAYFDALNARLSGAGSCEQLQQALDEVMASLSARQAAIEAQLALIGPIADLLVAPASNPAAIVTWISNFITKFLTPYVVPITVYEAQLVELATQVATLTATVATVQSQFESCEITVPSL